MTRLWVTTSAVFLAIAASVAPTLTAGAANSHANYHAVCPSANQGYARCNSQVVTNGQGNPATNTSPVGYGPAQFQGAYSLSGLGVTQSYAGTNVPQPTIGIVDAYDDPNAESDLAHYSTQFSPPLPACTTANGCFKKVNQNGGTSYPRKDAGWALEISLDVQTAHAICPYCKILLVEASSNSFANLFAAEDYATGKDPTTNKPRASVVSNSWGGGEFSQETLSSYDGHFSRPGVPITVSSGDSGFGVEYPAASQYVTAVGGTTLTLNGTTWSGETVWGGSGSGCSAYEPKPSWQLDGGCGQRTVADVAADADPNTGAAVYDTVSYQGQTGWFHVGGTSLASPLIASIYALSGNGSSTKYGSYPYSAVSYNNTPNMHDVTRGTNVPSTSTNCGTYLCNAGTGYDGPTGLGTPIGTGAF